MTDLSLDNKDPRERYLSLISLHESHVNLSPPIVFLFGGEIDSPHSVRGVLYKYIMVKHPALSNSLVIPENFKDWLHDSVYPDLLTFESDLAQTSSLIIIALESPGAIAELGSFSVNEALKDKIITIISEHHHNQDSFIKLGPLRQLQDGNVYSYPYDHKVLGNTLNEYLEDIINNVQSTLSKTQKSEQFNFSSNGHIALLIFEIILIYKALKISEIQKYLLILGIDIKANEVKRLLFLLGKLSFVSIKRLGNIDYFIPIRPESRITFSSKDKQKLFDRNAALIGTSQYYKSSTKEIMRKKVIELSMND